MMIIHEQNNVKEECMTALEELVEAANKLCISLEKAAENEKKFCQDLCLELERYAWETHRMTNGIRELKEIYGE